MRDFWVDSTPGQIQQDTELPADPAADEMPVHVHLTIGGRNPDLRHNSQKSTKTLRTGIEEDNQGAPGTESDHPSRGTDNLVQPSVLRPQSRWQAGTTGD